MAVWSIYLEYKFDIKGRIPSITILTEHNFVLTHHNFMGSRFIPSKGKPQLFAYEFRSDIVRVLPQNRVSSTREKTTEQKAREAKALKEVESILAEKRMKSGENQYSHKSPTPVSAYPSQTKGESRNIVAKKVGLKSGHEVDRNYPISLE